MKKFYDIFSDEPEIKILNPSIPIIIDVREKQSLVIANLIEKKANIKFEALDIADYLIGEIAIERKTFSDFISSMINKRLLKQLKELKKYSKHFLIVENFGGSFKQIRENVVRGMLLSIILDFQIPIIFTKNEEDTANFLILTAKKQEKSKTKISLRHSKTFPSLKEQKQFILEGFPGIGPSISQKLLEKFSTLENIFSQSEDELQKIEKFDKKKINFFKKILKE